MDSRVIAALIIGVAVGALGVIVIACLVIDGGKKNDIRDSGRAEGEAASEIQPKK